MATIIKSSPKGITASINHSLNNDQRREWSATIPGDDLTIWSHQDNSVECDWAREAGQSYSVNAAWHVAVILCGMELGSLQTIGSKGCQVFPVLPQLPKLWCKEQRGPHI